MKPNKIRPLALIIIRDGDRVFVTEYAEPITGRSFFRPLGGGIRFGERGAETVAREIKEELDTDLLDVRYIGTLENIFTYAGLPGHEIVLMYEARFADPRLHRIDRIASLDPEDDSIAQGVWKPLAAFGPDAPLYPDGLLDLLERAIEAAR